MQQSINIQQYCPGRTIPSDIEITQEIQFPSQSKIYPLDISTKTIDKICNQDHSYIQEPFYQ